MKLDKLKAYTISTEGVVSVLMPKNRRTFQLAEVQRVVEGYIEVVDLNDDYIMILNEDGKRDKEWNIIATQLAHSCGSIYPQDFICGNVVVCPSRMLP
jgi:hypothetical protein